MTSDTQSNLATHRPWGWYEVLAAGNGYQVKRLVVHPGKRLSLQYHRHRSEDWVVAAGSARLTINDKSIEAATGESFHVPVGASHRIANPHATDELVIIEVQLGEYLGEDDIVRTEDDFGRDSPSGKWPQTEWSKADKA